MINKKRLIKRFLDYVKIDSVSGQEEDFAARVVADLKRLGQKPSRDKAGNLILKIPGSIEAAPTIMLNAHLDTVGHPQKIKPKVCRGEVRSCGKTILGADNKAGVVAIMEALNVIKEEALPHGDILLIFTVQEEVGLKGAKKIKAKNLQADFGFVFDGGSPDVVHNQAPAQKSFEVWIKGRSAHAGVHPEDGINAIQVAAQALAKMKLGRIDQETTANIGIINGGEATNIVPDKVYLKGEVRSHNSKKLKKQINHIVACLKTACRSNKAQLEFNLYDVYSAFKISAQEKISKITVKALKNLGLKAKTKPSGGGSDANIFNKLGVKSLILGVGAHNLHGVKEKLVIKEFVQGAEMILELIKQCSRKH